VLAGLGNDANDPASYRREHVSDAKVVEGDAAARHDRAADLLRVDGRDRDVRIFQLRRVEPRLAGGRTRPDVSTGVVAACGRGDGDQWEQSNESTHAP
jgi:hypothetical protein